MQQIARDTPSCVEWLCCTLQFCETRCVYSNYSYIYSVHVRTGAMTTIST